MFPFLHQVSCVINNFQPTQIARPTSPPLQHPEATVGLPLLSLPRVESPLEKLSGSQVRDGKITCRNINKIMEVIYRQCMWNFCLFVFTERFLLVWPMHDTSQQGALLKWNCVACSRILLKPTCSMIAGWSKMRISYFCGCKINTHSSDFWLLAEMSWFRNRALLVMEYDEWGQMWYHISSARSLYISWLQCHQWKKELECGRVWLQLCSVDWNGDEPFIFINFPRFLFRIIKHIWLNIEHIW